MRQISMLLPKVVKRFLATCLALLAIAGASEVRAALVCGPFDKINKVGTCANGVPQSTFYSMTNGLWEWYCVGGGQSLYCSEGACGNGIIDQGEACDGKNLNGKTCTSLSGYSGGTLACRSDCTVLDFSGCTKTDVCGDGKVTGSEECDGSLNGQSCNSLGKGDGALSCYAKGTPKECKYNYEGCEWCGNNKIDAGEECDAFDLGGQTCKGLGFVDGDLACYANYDPSKACRFDTTECKSDKPVCGNGKAEDGEECDGVDFGGQTCVSKGCQSGNLKCNAGCKIEIETTDGFPAGCSRPCIQVQEGCSKKVTSPLGSSDFSIPCSSCGWAHKQFFSSTPTAGLCSDINGGSNTLANFKAVTNSLGQVYKWTWTCGKKQIPCEAYAEAKCRADISSPSLCLPDAYANALFKTNQDWGAKVNLRPQDRAYCDVGSKDSKMADGQYISDYCRRAGWDTSKNVTWVCKNTIGTGADAVSSIVNCSSGWGGRATCGSRHNTSFDAMSGTTVRIDENGNYIYGRDVTFGKCSQSSFWNNKTWSATEWCGPGATVIYSAYDYGTTDKDGNNTVTLNWKCQWNQAVTMTNGAKVERKGEIVDCNARIVRCNLSETGDDGKCGNDAFGSFPRLRANQPPVYTQPGSEKMNGIDQRCAFGTPSQPTFENAPNYRWNWNCVGDKSTANCSVKVKAACGPAEGKGFTNEDDLLNYGKGAVSPYGACGVGLLLDNKIKSTSKGWEWTCYNPDDATLGITCFASKCGSGHGTVYSQTAFNNKSATAGFLCAAGGTASAPTLVYNANSRTNRWTWSCQYGSQTVSGCYADELKCGWATNAPAIHSTGSFGVKKNTFPTFLCPNGFGSESELTENYSGWTWKCKDSSTAAGDPQEKVSCSVGKYQCGDLNLTSLTEASIANIVKNPSSLASRLCSNGGQVVDFHQEPYTAGAYSWSCKDPNESTVSVSGCYFDTLKCGEFSNTGNAITEATVNKYQSQNNTSVFCDRFYQVAITPAVKTLSSNNKALWQWSCTDRLGDMKTCTAERLECEPKDNGNIGIEKQNFTKDCSSGGLSLCNYDCMTDKYLPWNKTRDIISSMGYNGTTKTWSWNCVDSYNGLTDTCSAKCTNCQ